MGIDTIHRGLNVIQHVEILSHQSHSLDKVEETYQQNVRRQNHQMSHHHHPSILHHMSYTTPTPQPFSVASSSVPSLLSRSLPSFSAELPHIAPSRLSQLPLQIELSLPISDQHRV